MRLLAVGLACMVLALSACGGDEIGSMPTVGGPPEQQGRSFEVRPALSDPEPGDCEDDLAPEDPGVLCDLDGLAIRVGPAAVVDGVRTAQAVELREGSWGLQIELDDSSAAALTDLTQDAASSDSRIAVVIGGEVVSAPTVAGVIGGALQIAGDWSEQVAADLAEQARAAS